MKIIYLLLVVVILSGCANTNTQALNPCPTNIGDFDSLQTENRVIECLGKSDVLTSKPDGRHTALYTFDGGIMVVFLFNKNGSVIRNAVYKNASEK